MRTLALTLTLAASLPAAAQDQTIGESHYVGSTVVDVVVAWSERQGRPHGEVTVRAGGVSQTVHSGPPAHAWAAPGAEGLLVAVVGASETVEVAFIPVQDGRPRAPVRHAVRRLAAEDRAPIGAAVAARPDGFAVFWQEASTTNPNAIYETYVARFDTSGRPRGATARVHAPWPIADVEWLPERGRYYFLLFYGGVDPSGTRLCGVHVDDAQLRNLEHPFWVSRPAAIEEAHLLRVGERVLAIYRADGRLFEADVTDGGWGRNPAEPTDRGAIAPDTAYAVRHTGGRVEITRRPL